MSTLAPRHADHDTHDTIGATVPFEQINEPGCYVSNWTGHLLRIPVDGAVAPWAQISIVGRTPLLATRISDDPFIALSAARRLACAMDLRSIFRHDVRRANAILP